MKKQPAISVEQFVVPPDGGLITRFPSNQTFRRNYSGLSTASNVRAAAGRLRNAPGYEEMFFYPDLTTPPLLIFDADLQQGMYHVLGDAGKLYAVSPSYRPAVSAGNGGVVAGFGFTFSDATATGYLGQALGVTWLLISGPGTASFDDTGLIHSTVTVSDPGLYTFQVSGSDGLLTLTSQTTVRFITCLAQPNYTFPGSNTGGPLALTGEIFGESNPSDPHSDGSNYVWSQTSGPATIIFDDPDTDLSPNITVPNTPGNYGLRLTVSVPSTGTSYHSDIVVTVSSGVVDRSLNLVYTTQTGVLLEISTDGGSFVTQTDCFELSVPFITNIRLRVTIAPGTYNAGADNIADFDIGFASVAALITQAGSNTTTSGNIGTGTGSLQVFIDGNSPYKEFDLNANGDQASTYDWSGTTVSGTPGLRQDGGIVAGLSSGMIVTMPIVIDTLLTF